MICYTCARPCLSLYAPQLLPWPPQTCFCAKPFAFLELSSLVRSASTCSPSSFTQVPLPGRRPDRRPQDVGGEEEHSEERDGPALGGQARRAAPGVQQLCQAAGQGCGQGVLSSGLGSAKWAALFGTPRAHAAALGAGQTSGCCLARVWAGSMGRLLKLRCTVVHGRLTEEPCTFWALGAWVGFRKRCFTWHIAVAAPLL